jgi:hypothetical protein
VVGPLSFALAKRDAHCDWVRLKAMPLQKHEIVAVGRCTALNLVVQGHLACAASGEQSERVANSSWLVSVCRGWQVSQCFIAISGHNLTRHIRRTEETRAAAMVFLTHHAAQLLAALCFFRASTRASKDEREFVTGNEIPLRGL